MMQDSQRSTVDEMMMQEALKQAKLAAEADEVPVGAVVVFENKVIARAYNQVEMLKDPTAHAEMIAITQAANYLSNKWLHKCCLYVTVEPCAMCAGALVLSRIGRVCFGAADSKAGACGSVWNIADNNKLNHRVPVHQGVMVKECSMQIQQFFQKKRNQHKTGGP